ncbi:phage tail tape measure protein [Pseudooceanicola sp. CBS1P-1]|uniref:Phage tail tape measure protein n=1 Tax=Pseudooceanicola albus TaxID=2692189 RepID=A0A6L7GAR3_9RHOB|nr:MULTISPECIES: phage tail tape measure protein [Pseudooceanicola]MBT9387018.1 phage tail tape measure protein [Pseudooceanicola endophyticus]MXN21141.1 phage tail tape measure protein [Pseudooceanicola albus]
MAGHLVGRMQAVLGLDASGFKRALEEVRGKTNGFSRALIGVSLKIAAGMAGAIGSIGGITSATVAAASEVSRLAQVANASPAVFQKWAAAAGTVGMEQDQLADILKDVNDRVGDFLTTGGGPMADFFQQIAPKVGVTADQFRRLSGPEALQLYVSSLQKAGVNQQQMTFFMEAMASESTRLVPLLQEDGAEMARLGDRAEAVGAVLDDRTVGAMQNTRKALFEIQMSLTGMRNRIATAALPSLQMFADLLARGSGQGGVLTRVITALAGNLDRIVAYAGAVTVGVGTYLVGAFVAARVASLALSLSLSRLKAGLLASGFGLALVLAGELALRFFRLVQASGSLGAALALLREIGAEALGRIGLAGQGLLSGLKAVWLGIEAAGLAALTGVMSGAVTVTNRYIGLWRGAFAAIKALWGELPAVLGSLAYSAANAILGGIEALLNGTVERINSFIGSVNDKIPEGLKQRFSIGLVGKVELGGIANPHAGALAQAGAAAKGAFLDGFNTDTIPGLDTSGITGVADAARDAAGNAQLAAGAMGALATAPLASWEKLKTAMAGGQDAVEATTGAADTLGTAFRTAGTAGAAAGSQAAGGAAKVLKGLKDQLAELRATAGLTDAQTLAWQKLQEAGVAATSATGQQIAGLAEAITRMQQLKSATDSVREAGRNAFASLVTGAQSFTSVLSNLLASAATFFANKAFDSLWSAASGSSLTSGIGSLFKALVGAHANGTSNFAGGWTTVNERGGEILNLPSGTQIIPNDISKRMADGAARQGAGQTAIHVEASPYFDVRVAQTSGQVSGAYAKRSARSLDRASRSYNARGTTV